MTDLEWLNTLEKQFRRDVRIPVDTYPALLQVFALAREGVKAIQRIKDLTDENRI